MAVASNHSFCFLLSVAGAEEVMNGQKTPGQNADLEVWSTEMAVPTEI